DQRLDRHLARRHRNDPHRADGARPGSLDFQCHDGRRGVAVRLEQSPAAICLREPDRKSTRLNSSHGSISYAVFCLKKKKDLAASADDGAGSDGVLQLRTALEYLELASVAPNETPLRMLMVLAGVHCQVAQVKSRST